MRNDKNKQLSQPTKQHGDKTNFLPTGNTKFKKNQLFSIFISTGVISMLIGAIFLFFDPDVDLFGAAAEANQVTFTDVKFIVMKSPRGTEPRVVVYQNGVKIFTAGCNGVEAILCTEEYYKTPVKAKYLRVATTNNERGVLVKGELETPFGVAVEFINNDFEKEISNRAAMASSRAVNFLIFSVVLFLLAITVKFFENQRRK